MKAYILGILLLAAIIGIAGAWGGYDGCTLVCTHYHEECHGHGHGYHCDQVCDHYEWVCPPPPPAPPVIAPIYSFTFPTFRDPIWSGVCQRADLENQPASGTLEGNHVYTFTFTSPHSFDGVGLCTETSSGDWNVGIYETREGGTSIIALQTPSDPRTAIWVRAVPRFNLGRVSMTVTMNGARDPIISETFDIVPVSVLYHVH